MTTHRLLIATLVVTAAACSSSNSGGAGGSGSGGKSSASGGTTSSGGRSGTGGSSASGGSTATGGSGPGGQSSTGGVTGLGGSTATGGKTSSQSGGASGSGGGPVDAGVDGGAGKGGAAAGGNTGGGGSGIDGGGAGNGGAAAPSAGCGKTDGAKTLTTGGSSVSGALATSTRLKTTAGHEYIIDIPADYDPTHPYRLIFSWYQAYGSDTGNANGLYPANNGPNFDATNYAYFGLHREATAAKQPAIFVAPAGSGDLPWDYTRDSALFDELLALVDSNLCIDDSRVFTTGFSYGAMMSYGLSNGRASKLRAAVTMAPAQFGQNTGTTPIAYMSTTGMTDGRCVWGDANSGGEGCVIQHAKDNGCTIPATIPEVTSGSKKYVCYDFEGCKAGYPVKVCRFDGAHTPSAVDDGTNGGDDGLKAFIPPLAWQFISQF